MLEPAWTDHLAQSLGIIVCIKASPGAFNLDGNGFPVFNGNEWRSRQPQPSQRSEGSVERLPSDWLVTAPRGRWRPYVVLVEETECLIRMSADPSGP
jgi:hypothetical protein